MNGWRCVVGATIVLLLMGVCAASVAASSANMPRNIQFAHVTTAQGLSQQFVQSVVQDARGYIWFGTQEGLNRYDGHSVVSYVHDRSQKGSLSDSFVWSMMVDRAGALWVATEHGVNRYDPRTDTFTQPFAALGGRNKVGEPRVRSIIQDRNGVFWLGTMKDGIIAIDPVHATVQRWLPQAGAANTATPGSVSGLPEGAVIALLEDSRGQLWLGLDGGGLVRFDRVTKTFIQYRHSAGNPTSLSDDHVRAIHEDRNGRIWVGTATGGLNLLDSATDAFEHFAQDPRDATSLSGGQVSAILEDRRGTLWVGTENGLCERRTAGAGFNCYGNNPLDTSSLINERVNALFEDRSGVLWVGTRGGASRWNRVSETFSYYRASAGYLSVDTVSAVAEARDGSLWVGTYGGGLSHFNLASGKVQHFRTNSRDPRSLSDDRVMALHVDANDTLWVGTRSGGLNRLAAGAQGFTHYVQSASDATTLGGNGITSLQSDATGALWIGVFDGGLSRLGVDGRFKHFRHNPNDLHSLSSDRVINLYRDRTGLLWIGTEGGGLNRIDTRSERIERIQVRAGAHDEQRADTVWDVTESSDGSLWIATQGRGLYRWNATDRARKRQRFSRHLRANGLTSDSVYAVLEGGPDVLWLSTSRGLTEFDTNNGQMRHLDQGNGLRSNEFNVGARLRTRNGRLYFGGTDGLVGFHPGELASNSHAPLIAVSAFSHDERLATADAGGPAVRIELGYLDPFVTFEFVALDFVSPDKNRYRYRLEGHDDAWIDSGDFRRATYSHLPPGEYLFHVQAANNDNVWNSQKASISVHVQPKPWLSNAAYFAYALVLFVVGVYGWRHVRTKASAEAAKQQQLEQMVEERTRALEASMRELEHMNRQFAEASVTDALTGLRNRRYLEQVMLAEVARVERRVVESAHAGVAEAGDSSQLMFFMMIDLDGFKHINDTHGHHAGDEALVQVKDILLECCRQSDSVIRWGGDEFMVIGHASGFFGAKVLAERVREGIATHRFKVAGVHYCSMTASVGLAPFPFCEHRVGFSHWEQVAAVADQCAYLAKTNGRNAWVSVSGTLSTQLEDLHEIAVDLAACVGAGRLVLDSSLPRDVLLPARAAQLAQEDGAAAVQHMPRAAG